MKNLNQLFESVLNESSYDFAAWDRAASEEYMQKLVGDQPIPEGFEETDDPGSFKYKGCRIDTHETHKGDCRRLGDRGEIDFWVYLPMKPIGKVRTLIDAKKLVNESIVKFNSMIQN